MTEGGSETKAGDVMKFLHNPDRVRIFKDGEEVLCGFFAMLEHRNEGITKEEIEAAQLKDFRASIEINHKQWKEKGLMQPLLPRETAQYNFTDLMMSLYYIIKI